MVKNIIILLSFFSISWLYGQRIHHIPTQKINLFELVRDKAHSKVDTVLEFEISEFVTFKEYKEYLSSIKKDSSNTALRMQYPDSNISRSVDVYNEYITNNEYDAYPVLGISWDNAMNYCKWKTLNDNKQGNWEFYYRLPYRSEWLAAIYYYSKNGIETDMNDKYSDWLINAYDESFYDFSIDVPSFFRYYDYQHFHRKDDAPALKRKRFIGNSYLFQQNYYNAYQSYGYADEGYRNIAFRIVKVNVRDSTESKYSYLQYLKEFWCVKNE